MSHNSIAAKEAVFWVNYEAKRVHVTPIMHDRDPSHEWSDPIGANYVEWGKATKKDRVLTMLETAIDLMVQGFEPKHVLAEFAKVDEFFALGRESYPMCSALTTVLVGCSLEPTTMSFDALLARYKPGEPKDTQVVPIAGVAAPFRWRDPSTIPPRTKEEAEKYEFD